MIVILNNGTRIKILKEFAQTIFQNLVKDTGATEWQIRMDIGSNRLTAFNLDHVSAICEEEDILTPEKI